MSTPYLKDKNGEDENEILYKTPEKNISNVKIDKDAGTESKKAENESLKGRVGLDSILEEVGELGSYQWRVVALCGVIAIFAAWATSEYVFTTASINTRCMIPECDLSPPEWHPGWVHSAIPSKDSGTLDNCRRFPLAANASVNISDPVICPVILFNQSSIQACESYVYENTDSIVYDYDLACDEWRRTLIGSMSVVGQLLGMPLSGYISDRWGRRVMITVYAINTAVLGILRIFAKTYIGFLTSKFVESLLGSGTFTGAYILLIEVMSAKHRTAAAATITSAFAVGQMILGLIAWKVPHWKNLTLTLYVPQFLAIFYFWLLKDSVRWYISKERYEESEKILQKIARTNGRTLNPNSLFALRQTAQEDKKRRELDSLEKKNEPWLPVTVFKHKNVLLRCIVAPVWWITNIFIYYALSINSVNMVGNRHLNYVAVSAVEILGFWTPVFLLDRIGRKPVLMSGLWICAACQVAYIFMPPGFYGLPLLIYCLGKYAISVVAMSLYVYTAELYPTKHRHTMFSFTSMIGRIGAITAPLTPAFGAATFAKFPFVLFGSFALISGFLMFLTPETLGTELPDTMEEADKLYKTTFVKDRGNHQ